MSDSKRDRFLHLERGRSTRLEERVKTEAGERFAGVEERRETEAGEPASGSSSRFDPDSAPVEVGTNSDDEQPFVSCARCGAECGKFAERCPTCLASFDTHEQREHNARVWQKRKEALDDERRESAARDAQLLAAAAALMGRQPGIGASINNEILEEMAERERANGGAAISAWGRSPVGWLLRSLPGPWDVGVGAVLFVVPILLMTVGDRGGTAFEVGLLWILLLALSFAASYWLLNGDRDHLE